MKYRLGIDVGTASLGLAAIALSPNNIPIKLLDHDVRIFAEPLENAKGTLKSKKAGRRLGRQARRQRDRRMTRQRRIAALAPLLGLHAFHSASDSGRELPRLRAQAARDKVSLQDLLHIFMRLSKRRGYRGDFLPRETNKKLGEVEAGSNDLKRQMAQLALSQGFDRITLGEYLYERHQQGLPTKLKVAEKRDDTKDLTNLYALRMQVEAEFEHLWQTQSLHHPILDSSHDGKPVKKIFHTEIFHQRPLKSARGMVGQCPLEPTLPRAPKAQMAFQRFRIEKTLSDLRWGVGNRAEVLSVDQKNIIRTMLDDQGVASFTTIITALKKAGLPPPDGRGLNLDRSHAGGREELPGNKTNAAFRALGLIESWLALDERTQIQVINFLAELGSPEELDDPCWHNRFAAKDGTIRSFSPAVVDFVTLLKNCPKFDRLSKMGFDGGRAGYSVKALNRLSDWIASPWWPRDWQDGWRIDEEAAIRQCYPQRTTKSLSPSARLAAPTPTGNAVVDGSLRQIYRMVNGMIDRLGEPPTEIVVEMARDMGLGITKRNEREVDINNNRKARKNAEDAIRDHGATVTPSRVRRYLLWREQGETYCPYCENAINIGKALDGAETEYEHIVPRSLTQVGFKRSEIVLAHRSCNHAKGNNTPWEAWGNGHDPARWAVVEQRAAWFKKNKQDRKARLLLLKEFEREVINDETIEGFADRQFHQTSWIAKATAQWMQSICPTPVSVSRGELTARLRRNWGLETVIPEVRLEEGYPVLDEDDKLISEEEFTRFKPFWEGHSPHNKEGYTDRRPNKRLDHRHHLIDAITIALTSRGLFQRMAQQYKTASETCEPGKRPKLETPPPPLPTVRQEAIAAVRKCRLTIKPDRYPDGAIFKDQAYSSAWSQDKGADMLTLHVAVADLIDQKKSVEGTKKAIASIVSAPIRAIVLAAFEARIAKGLSVPAALAEPILQNLYGEDLPIKRVKCFTGGYAANAVAIKFKNPSKPQRPHKKFLLNEGYAYLELTCEGESVRSYRLVTIQEAMKARKKPEPGDIRLYKSDTVLDTDDNNHYRIGYFKNRDGIFLVPIFDPRSYDEIDKSNKANKLRGCSTGIKSIGFKGAWRLKLVN